MKLMRTEKFTTSSPGETIRKAKAFAGKLEPGNVVAFYGDLGSGKTTFIKGIALGLGLPSARAVKSPTFVVMHIYRARIPVYHFDLYRLEDGQDLEAIGLDDFLNDPGAISCVEWAQKASARFPAALTYEVGLEILGPDRRRITIRRAAVPGRARRLRASRLKRRICR